MDAPQRVQIATIASIAVIAPAVGAIAMAQQTTS